MDSAGQAACRKTEIQPVGKSMSLDVYLRIPGHKAKRSTGSGIFVRENGQTVEISKAEWMDRHPDLIPARSEVNEESDDVFSANITHNLGKMAEEAGIYECLWRPDELGITQAESLIKLLSEGLRKLKRDPERFIPLNPPNGWGSYDDFVPWLERYLIACITYPEAKVSVWK
jgi:hypothetical protein